MDLLKASGNAAGRLCALASAAALLGALLFSACQREFDNPFHPQSGDYAGSDWSRDGDGDGVADSVAKYAPGCAEGPADCLRKARANAGISVLETVTAEDINLLAGGFPATPRVQWRPPGARDVTWELVADDPAVARPEGKAIHPVAPGLTHFTVTARTPNGPPRTARFRVLVAAERVPVASLAAADVELAPGETRASGVRVLPENATDPRIELITLDPGVVSVSQGLLVAGKAGRCLVTARSLDGGHQALFTVVVRRKVSGISAQPMTLKVGDPAVRPVLTFQPPDATNQDWKLSGGQAAIAHPTSDGLVMPVGPGTTLFTVTVEGGLTAEFQVTVEAVHVPVKEVKVHDLHFPTFSGPDGAVREPVITWTPANASDKAYTMVSQDPDIARVVGNGIQAVRTGETKVILTTRDGARRDTFKVKITALIGCGGVLDPCDDDDD